MVFQAVQEVTFVAQTSDANHTPDDLVVLWKTDQRTLCQAYPPQSSGEAICVATMEQGDEHVIVQVTDPENASGIDSIDIINSNTPPTVSILSPTATGAYYADEMSFFSAEISDTEDTPDLLQYT